MPTPRSRGHEPIDHPADLAVRFWAPSEAELLVEAAQALVAIMTDGATVRAEQARAVRLDAVDPEDRLVRWLNEVLVLAAVEGFVLADAELRLRAGGLDAELRGQPGSHELIQHELKSVTYHDLELRREGAGFVGRVVIDV